MTDFAHTATLGAGVIGASWTALFLASGRSVAVYDPAPDTETSVRTYIDTAWPVLTELGLTANGTPDAVTFHTSPKDAIAGATFIQESVPERLPIKHDLYAQIDGALDPDAIISSSASGLTLTEMQQGWSDPSQLVLGHPFNPPHLIPLVEVMGNDRTAPGLVEKAEAFYKAVGKVTIRVNREVPGHVANRLQAALWREAIHLVATGVATVEDIDTAIWAGPGLRWSAMGPNLLWHLAAGEGGLAEYCQRYGDSFNRWWDTMGTPYITDDIAAQLAAGVADEAKGASIDELAAERDAILTAVQVAIAKAKSRT